MGRNWAITIGINEYDNLRALQYAERDAESVRDFCLELGFEEVYFFAKNALPILGSNGAMIPADPTTSRLRNFLRRRFQGRPLGSGDTLWFFFAGHGKRQGERDYLMPIDSDPGDVTGTGLAVRDLAEVLRGSGAGNVILLVDACRDDGSRDGLGIGLEHQQGVITLFSCAPEQQSYEIEELQAGAFTYALLQGLRIQGEGNCATVARLTEHVRVQVPYLVERYRKVRQNPYLVAEPASKQNLILLPRQATPADLLVLKYAASQAEIEGDLELAEVFWSRVLVSSPSSYPEVFQAIQRLGIKKHTPGHMFFGAQQRTDSVRQANFGMRGGSDDNPKGAATRLEMFEFEVVQLDSQGQVSKREWLQNQGFIQSLTGDVSLTMMQIPAGKFLMGAPASEEGKQGCEEPQHEVVMIEFFMAQTPITQAQWRSVASLSKLKIDLKEDPSYFKGDLRPVEQVSWEDAVEFCARLSRLTGVVYRLPSEAEWEYACRARTTTPFHFGDTITTDWANYRGTTDSKDDKKGLDDHNDGTKGQYRQETTPVDYFGIANAFGLCDMNGNVLEWCLDQWHSSYEGAPNNGTAWLAESQSSHHRPSRQVIRGGSWIGERSYCRSAWRIDCSSRMKEKDVGFRVVVVTPNPHPPTF